MPETAALGYSGRPSVCNPNRLHVSGSEGAVPHNTSRQAGGVAPEVSEWSGGAAGGAPVGFGASRHGGSRTWTYAGAFFVAEVPHRCIAI